jgi:hypothetical protein
MFIYNLSWLCKKYDVIPDVILRHFLKPYIFKKVKIAPQFFQELTPPFLCRRYSQSKRNIRKTWDKKARLR